MPEICASCSDAVHNEAGHTLDPDTTAIVAIQLGADLPDHYCDKTEEPLTRCACGCQTTR